MIRFIQLFVISNLILTGQVFALDDPHSEGKALFETNCAICHAVKGAKAPEIDALKAMEKEFIIRSLSQGRMSQQGSVLSSKQVIKVVDYLTHEQPPRVNWAEAAACEDKRVNLKAGPVLGDWGYGAENQRRTSIEDGGISAATVSKLQLKWGLAFPRATQMRSQPVLVGDTLFLAIYELHRVYALDANTGCVKWEFATTMPARSHLGYGEVDGRGLLWLGDSGANVYVIDAETGKALWQRSLGLFKHSMITAQSVLHDRTLFVPMSLYEIISAGNPSYECCKGHGGIIAVDVLTGEEKWTYHSEKTAVKTHKSSIGVQQWGPSGSPVWNAPAIDTKRGLIYFGTGENLSIPATENSDALMALDMTTGKRKWLFQATAKDIFNNACMGYYYGGKHGPNCPNQQGVELGPDHDFGGPVMIVTLPNGKDILLAGQKSGVVWALDPDNNGKLVWSTRLSEGTPSGGIHWGMAYDGERLIVPINDPDMSPFNPILKPALHALDPATGDIVWTVPMKPSCEFSQEQSAAEKAAGKPQSCHRYHGISAPPTVVGDVVFVGNLEGMFRAYATATGELLWERSTNIPIQGANGVSGHGGAIDNNGPLISAGRVYIQSGYGMFGQIPGNVLLQYTLDGK
jgi:polyvinyl alcohol dehydrogenase (cytochrome)